LAGEGLQARGQFRGQDPFFLVVVSRGSRIARPREPKVRRGRETAEGGLPVSLAGGPVASLEPVDVIPVRAGRRQRGVSSLAERLVAGKDLSEDHEPGPAIEQGVVGGPDEAVLPAGKAEHSEPEKGRVGEREPAAVADEEDFPGWALTRRRLVPPVV